MAASSEVDLSGFEQLWEVDYQETQKFIQLKKSNQDDQKQKSEIYLLNKELEDKSFELQKLNWQISEREKELKNLYDEVHKLIELNKKLNLQLRDFERLASKQEALIELLVNGTDAEVQIDPVLPNF